MSPTFGNQVPLWVFVVPLYLNGEDGSKVGDWFSLLPGASAAWTGDSVDRPMVMCLLEL